MIVGMIVVMVVFVIMTVFTVGSYCLGIMVVAATLIVMFMNVWFVADIFHVYGTLSLFWANAQTSGFIWFAATKVCCNTMQQGFKY